jgi:hypothetical protein
LNSSPAEQLGEEHTTLPNLKWLNSNEFGGVYSGKKQIRAGFVEPLMEGFHVDSSNHQLARAQEGVGERVIWTAMVSGEFFRQMGVEPPVESSAEAIVEGEKIKSFTATNPAAP